MPVTVLIVDDHAVVRQGLRTFLSLDPEIEIVGEAVDGAEAYTLASSLHPDVVLMDLLMPTMDGMTAITRIRRDIPETEVIALTAVMEDKLVGQAIQAGAIGYLLKDSDAFVLRKAIKAVAAGQLVLSPKIAARLARELPPPTARVVLTERELQVLTLVARGCSNKEIGLMLHISGPTVKSHITNILGKLGVTSRTQAIIVAHRLGIVTLDTAESGSVTP